MTEILEKIDTVVARTSCTYKEAKEALEICGGDVVDAIIHIEDNRNSWANNISEKGDKMIDKLKEILRKGNVTKITIKKDGDIILSLPVTAAIVGGIISAPLTLIGFGSAVLAKCVIEVEKEDGEIININNLVERNIDSN
ncbi:MAG: DUF4342 domain-containing protein [Tissierellia bacterium]|nr:DUF4342 domain-containing protein [Tissierellia bacterium]